MQNLKEAHLTHPFHCCAFKYPEQHDPKGYAEYQDKIKKACEDVLPTLDTGQFAKAMRRRRDTNRLGDDNLYWADPFE